MANLKIGTGHSVDDIGFRMPLNILQKHSEKCQDSLNNLISSQVNMTISKFKPQNICVRLNKSDFINDTLKNNVSNKILQPCLQNYKPRIIEFR